MDYNFSNVKQGLGISKFLTHVSQDCQDLITKLLIYNQDDRLSAKQALSHPHFKDLVEHEAKMTKLSLNNFNSVLMKSFHNESNSMSKSPEDTQIQGNTKRKEKVNFLPDIKVNIIIDNKKTELDDSDDNKNTTYLKLPKINKGGDNYNLNLKMIKNNNTINQNIDNKNNQSMEIQINTQYSKKNPSMGKKVFCIK